MNTNIDHAPAQRSATIIQFPAGGRAGLSVHHDDGAQGALQDMPNVMYGNAWYHDAAIAQAVTPKKS
jgi:hypothetical protein